MLSRRVSTSSSLRPRYSQAPRSADRADFDRNSGGPTLWVRPTQPQHTAHLRRTRRTSPLSSSAAVLSFTLSADPSLSARITEVHPSSSQISAGTPFELGSGGSTYKQARGLQQLPGISERAETKSKAGYVARYIIILPNPVDGTDRLFGDRR